MTLQIHLRKSYFEGHLSPSSMELFFKTDSTQYEIWDIIKKKLRQDQEECEIRLKNYDQHDPKKMGCDQEIMNLFVL